MKRHMSGMMRLTIGEMLMIIRQRRGLSQKALSELTYAGLPVSEIAAIEADEWENVRLSAVVDAFAAVDTFLNIGLSLMDDEEE